MNEDIEFMNEVQSRGQGQRGITPDVGATVGANLGIGVGEAVIQCNVW
jgi:hypothetical protein